MRTTWHTTIAALALCTFYHSANTVHGGFIVPGSSNPYLAGMPDGTVASVLDIAPSQSPVEVIGVPIVPGNGLFFSSTGLVAYSPDVPLDGPDGSFFFGGPFQAPENGISRINAPADSLVGVFIGLNQPDLSPAPIELDFSVPGALDYLSLSPELQQVFFIGDGKTSGDLQQVVIVPNGATRLFLGTIDGFGWLNNVGEFNVEVSTAAPEPSTLMLFGSGAVGLVAEVLRRRRHKPAA